MKPAPQFWLMIYLGVGKIKDGQGPTCDCQKGRRHARWSWVEKTNQQSGWDHMGITGSTAAQT